MSVLSESPGADLIARLYMLGDNGQLDGRSGTELVSSVISFGYAYASQECRNSIFASQNITLECANPIFDCDDPTPELNCGYDVKLKESANCALCIDQVQKLVKARQSLDQEAHLNNGNYKVPTIDPALLERLYGQQDPSFPYANGVCAYVCRTCVAMDVNQNTNIGITSECTISASFISSFSTGVTIQAQNEISRYRTQLASTGVTIESDKNIADFGIHIGNTIIQIADTESLSALRQSAISEQTLQLGNGVSYSLAVQRLEQSITITMFASLVSRIFTDERVKNQIDYDRRVRTIKLETSFTSLLDSLRSTITTFNQLMGEFLGRLMMSIVVLLIVVVFIMVSVIGIILERTSNLKT